MSSLTREVGKKGTTVLEIRWLKERFTQDEAKIIITIIDIELGKAGMGETTLEGTDLEDCQGLEYHQLDFCQSTDDSSSANFELDKDALLSIEVNKEDEREKAEEEGFEGIRYLMESQVGKLEGHFLYDADRDDKIRVGNE